MVTIGYGRLEVRWESSRLRGGVEKIVFLSTVAGKGRSGTILFISCTNMLSVESLLPRQFVIIESS